MASRIIVAYPSWFTTPDGVRIHAAHGQTGHRPVSDVLALSEASITSSQKDRFTRGGINL